MFKTIVTITLTVLVVLFSIENFDKVPVSFIAGKPVNMQLIFVIAISGIIGYLIRHFYAIATEERLKRQIQQLIRMKNSGKKIRIRNTKDSSNRDANAKQEILVDEFEDEEEI